MVFDMGNRALEEAQQLLCEDDPLYWAVIMKQADLLYTIYDQNLGPNHGTQGLQALEKYCSLTNQGPLAWCSDLRRISGSLAL